MSINSCVDLELLIIFNTSSSTSLFIAILTFWTSGFLNVGNKESGGTWRDPHLWVANTDIHVVVFFLNWRATTWLSGGLTAKEGLTFEHLSLQHRLKWNRLSLNEFKSLWYLLIYRHSNILVYVPLPSSQVTEHAVVHVKSTSDSQTLRSRSWCLKLIKFKKVEFFCSIIINIYVITFITLEAAGTTCGW